MSTSKRKRLVRGLRENDQIDLSGTEMVTVYCEDDPDIDCYCDCEDYKCEEEVHKQENKCKYGSDEDEVWTPIGYICASNVGTLVSVPNYRPDLDQGGSDVASDPVKTTVQTKGQEVVSESNEKQKRTFMIHKAFACRYSAFFDKAFNGSWIEPKTDRVTVQTNPSIFSILARWLYSKRL